jgi:hypothetical protein
MSGVGYVRPWLDFGHRVISCGKIPYFICNGNFPEIEGNDDLANGKKTKLVPGAENHLNSTSYFA